MRVFLDEGAFLPERAYEDDAGFDLRAIEKQTVRAKDSAKFDTGVHIDIPRGYVGFLKSKSGLSIKHGLTSEGVIDAGYTGSIVVKLYNNSSDDYIVEAGDKISQIVILPISMEKPEVVDTIWEAERGKNGFGSSGR